MRLLEIGCGSGTYVRHAAERTGASPASPSTCAKTSYARRRQLETWE